MAIRYKIVGWDNYVQESYDCGTYRRHQSVLDKYECMVDYAHSLPEVYRDTYTMHVLTEQQYQEDRLRKKEMQKARAKLPKQYRHRHKLRVKVDVLVDNLIYEIDSEPDYESFVQSPYKIDKCGHVECQKLFCFSEFYVQIKTDKPNYLQVELQMVFPTTKTQKGEEIYAILWDDTYENMKEKIADPAAIFHHFFQEVERITEEFLQKQHTTTA